MAVNYRVEQTSSLLDFEFQDFMADEEVKVIHRVEVAQKSVEALKNVKNYSIGSILIEDLLTHRGYLRRPYELATKAYGAKYDEFELRSLDTILFKIKRRKLVEGLFHHRGVGWGIGLEDFNLSPSELKLLYLLWLDFGEPVPRDKLINKIFPLNDSYTRKNLNNTLLGLRKKIPASSQLIVQTIGRAEVIGQSFDIDLRLNIVEAVQNEPLWLVA